MGLPLPDLVIMAWKSVSSQWIRSSLTAFGVFMGVAAVSATLNIQTITQTQIDQNLAKRDKPFIIPAMWGRGFNGVSEEHILELQRTMPMIRAISTTANLHTIDKLQFEAQELSDFEARSVSLNYLDTTGRTLLRGRFFNQADLNQYRAVAIVDQQLVSNLFNNQNPINQAIYARGARLVVIGVVGTRSNDPDYETQGTIWLTDNYGQVLQQARFRKQLQISPYQLEDLAPLQEQVETFLSERYPSNYIYVYSNARDLLEQQQTQKIASRALTGVGLVALIIGGVGIANITVATVMERTKEIGIRRAIGASQLEIMTQFILEAVLLSLVGGMAAVLTVHSLTNIVTTNIIQAPYQFSNRNAASAMGSAIIVGVVSSFFPAWRATQIDIVKALRGN